MYYHVQLFKHVSRPFVPWHWLPSRFTQSLLSPFYQLYSWPSWSSLSKSQDAKYKTACPLSPDAILIPQLSWQSSAWSYCYVISQLNPKHPRFFRRWTPLHHQVCLSLTNVLCVPFIQWPLYIELISFPTQLTTPANPAHLLGPTQYPSFSKKHSAVLFNQPWSFPTLRLTAFTCGVTCLML